MKKAEKESSATNGNVNRRSFIKSAWAWLGVIAGIEFTALSINMLIPGKRATMSGLANVKKVGVVENILPGSVTPFKDGQFYLVRTSDGGFLALSLSCTHLGCSIGFDNEKHQFICPCHASVFDINGNVLNPPAPRALDTYRVFIEKGQLFVDTNQKIKRKKFMVSDLLYA